MTPREKANDCLRKWRRTPKGLLSVAKGIADRKARRELERVGQSFKSAAVQNVLTMWGST